MSLELETLDQLLGGEMPLAVIRGLFPDDPHFARAIHALLTNGDVRLLQDEDEIPPWRWRGLFVDGAVFDEMPSLRLSITERGVQRIA